MKKTFRLCLAVLATAFAFTSCEDVPAPYNVPTNPNTPGGGNTETPAPAGEGTQASPYNVAAIIPLVAAMPADQESEQEYYITGTIVGTPSINTTYGNADFNIADPANPGKTFKIFRAMSFEGAKFTNANALKEGDVVVLKGKVVNYKGNTPETAGNKSQLVSVNGKTEFEAGGETPDPGTPSTPGLTVSGTQMFMVAEGVTAGTETAVIDFTAQNLTDKTAVTTVEAEGCTITFSGGTNTNNAPTYYAVSKGVRMYANNVVTFTSTKRIASVTLQCDSYNGTDYVGNATRTFNVQDNVFTLTNAHTAASGGVQIRVQTATFTFAE